MKRQIFFFLGFILFTFIITILYLFIFREFSPEHPETQQTLLGFDSDEALTALIPQDCVLVNCSKPESITAPFTIAKNPDQKSEKVLTLPAEKGTAGAKNTGKATFKVKVPNRGQYKCWARVRWNDNCSNSLIFQIGSHRKKIFGQDSVYNSWHWVPIGEFELTSGPHTVTLKEREDGIAVDQLLLSPDIKYHPKGKIVAGKDLQESRQFADSFYRSEGHGLKNWDIKSGEWKLMFSLDPNRIPLQYALQGTAEKDQAALCELKEISFPGAIYQFNLYPLEPGTYGLNLEENSGLNILLAVKDSGTRLQIDGAGITQSISLGDKVRIKQWHHLSIERWATILKVEIDGKTVFRSSSLSPSEEESIAFKVDTGKAVFDDFSAKEIIYLSNSQIPWQVTGTDSLWARGKKTPLIGFRGEVNTPEFRLNIKEIILNKQGPGKCMLNGKSISVKESAQEKVHRVFSGDLPDKISLELENDQKIQFNNIALRFEGTTPDIFSFGPYDFNKRHVEDISDYMDFTDEEIRQMNTSPKADKLKRKARKRNIVGKRYASVWGSARRKHWKIVNGVLQGRPDRHGLTFWQELNGDFEIRFKIKLNDKNSAGKVILYSNKESAWPLTIASADYLKNKKSKTSLVCPETEKWLPVIISSSSEGLKARIGDGKAEFFKLKRGNGGEIKLMVSSGTVEFDDISISLSRKSNNYRFYAFDRRETDWWREGDAWCDHSGVACVFASNWTTLKAPNSSGMMLHKCDLNDNLLLAFNTEEASEWFGWTKKPQHVHHPWDNVTIKFSSRGDCKKGYEIQINANNRSRTLLLRNGKEVASVDQNRNFPIRYNGGHSPYSPRRCRVVVRRHTDEIILYLNGKKVLSYKDPEPIKTPKLRIGGFNTHINFSNIELMEFKE